jgi:hypothetical protein
VTLGGCAPCAGGRRVAGSAATSRPCFLTNPSCHPVRVIVRRGPFRCWSTSVASVTVTQGRGRQWLPAATAERSVRQRRPERASRAVIRSHRPQRKSRPRTREQERPLPHPRRTTRLLQRSLRLRLVSRLLDAQRTALSAEAHLAALTASALRAATLGRTQPPSLRQSHPRIPQHRTQSRRRVADRTYDETR